MGMLLGLGLAAIAVCVAWLAAKHLTVIRRLGPDWQNELDELEHLLNGF